MDMYTILGIKRPTIAYTVLHQSQPEIQRADYLSHLQELYDFVGEHWENLNGDMQKEDHPGLGPISWAEYALHVQVENDSGLTEKLASGRDYLAGFGINMDAGAPPAQESILVFEGSAGYDIIEYIVRDRMGIYAPPHYDHVQQLARGRFGTYDRVSQIEGDVTAWQGVFAFNKGSSGYDEFRRALRNTMAAVGERTGWGGMTAWQRKLGLGYGREFVLRIELDDEPANLADAVAMIQEHGEEPARTSLVRFSKLMLSEHLMP
ncbi:MAG: hypothetical protein ACE5HA_06875 [Anaerolineae bacterium]